MWKNITIGVAGLAVLASCSTTKIAENAVPLDVSYSWTAKSGCQPVSPPITVNNVPSNTKYLRVSMKDLDAPNYHHGGGEVAYSGSGAIPEGALKSFEGPCPPGGFHRYVITVQALNADKSLVIGQGKKGKRFPPK